MNEEPGQDVRPYPNNKQSRDAVGEKIGMSGRTYERAKHIRDNAPQEAIDRLDKGESTVYKEYTDLRAQMQPENIPENIVPLETTIAVGIPDIADINNPEDKGVDVGYDESKNLQSVSRIPKPLSKEDEEAQQKICEFNALPPIKKIEVLQEQLRQERARAASAESELRRERELHHNTKYHSKLSIANLEGQVAELSAKIAELTNSICIPAAVS
jgi:hypothetical protein